MKITLKALYKSFMGTPNSSWIMEYPNAEYLYKFVKERPIKKVLDLGLGIGVSASVVALALKDKGEGGHVDSIEQWDKCIKMAEKMIPAELKEFITIHKSETAVWQNPDILYQHFSTFVKTPEIDYDLIIVDGPAFWQENGKFVDLPNGDTMKWLTEGKLKPGTFVAWDGRIPALKLLERFYADNFVMTQLAPRGNDFNVLKRVDNEVKFVDSMLEAIKRDTNYFKDEKI